MLEDVDLTNLASVSCELMGAIWGYHVTIAEPLPLLISVFPSGVIPVLSMVPSCSFCMKPARGPETAKEASKASKQSLGSHRKP